MILILGIILGIVGFFIVLPGIGYLITLPFDGVDSYAEALFVGILSLLLLSIAILIGIGIASALGWRFK